MSITKKIFVSAFVAAFALAVGSADAAYMHSVTLKQGSSGAQVTSLQTTLNMGSCKVGSGLATGYFGSLTAAAVKCFQAANGLTADGIVGPMTGNKLGLIVAIPAGNPNQPCPSGYTCTPTGNGGGNNDGTQGTINDVSELSQYNNEEVAEGDEGVKVAGFEVEASNDGDIDLISMKISFDPTGNNGSDNLDDYLDSVSIWMGDKEVGSADAEDFSQDNDDVWNKIITLSGATVDSDDTEKFYIAVDAASNLDSGDIDGSDDSWTVDLTNIRFKDGSGVVSTETDQGDIGSLDVPISFVDFGTAADTELKLTTASDSPDAGIVIVDTTDSTDDVVLLKGKIKLEGTSDVVIDEFPVLFTVTGATDVDTVTGSVKLVIDGEEYTESVSTSAETSTTVVFNNLDFDLSAGDTIEFEVRADINDIETGAFDEGDTLTASVNSTNRDNMDVENEEGDQLSDANEKSGTSTGEAQEFRSEGVSVTLVSTDATKSASDTANSDTATFEIKFKVTAVGDAVYVASTASTGGAINNTYTVNVGSSATLTDVSEAIVNVTDTDLSSGGNWLIEDGESETITLTVLRSGSDTDGLYRALLSSIKWNTTDSSSTYNSYTSNLDSFKTAYVDLD